MIDDLENRFTYHEPRTKDRVDTYVKVRAAALDLARLLDAEVPDGREKSLSLTHLEEVVFWANAGIARS